MISMFLLHTINSFSQQVFTSFVHYQLKLILIAILKKSNSSTRYLFYSEQWKCVNSKQNAHDVFTQNNLQLNPKHTLDHKNAQVIA